MRRASRTRDVPDIGRWELRMLPFYDPISPSPRRPNQERHTKKAAMNRLLVVCVQLRMAPVTATTVEIAARSIVYGSSSFLGALPAPWSHCQEVVIACPVERSLLHQLRQGLCGPASTPLALVSTTLYLHEDLEGALRHAQELSPHDVLELQRLRLKSGTWPVREEEIGARRQRRTV